MLEDFIYEIITTVAVHYTFTHACREIKSLEFSLMCLQIFTALHVQYHGKSCVFFFAVFQCLYGL